MFIHMELSCPVTANFWESIFAEIAKITQEQTKPSVELALLNFFITESSQCKQKNINFLLVADRVLIIQRWKNAKGISLVC